MLKKLLIANRGEIACRIVRTARRLAIPTLAVYSDADARALHVAAADAAVHIGASPATESYLRGDKIIAVAKAHGADAIHPGYGFLSENADFADAVTKAGLKFVGPSAKAMRALGGKAAAKEIALHAGVPVVPGYQGARQDAASLAVEARKIGYPVMIKAVAGGGGRGMRLVEREADLAELLDSAQREALSAFANPLVLIEKVVQRPRHIEVQVFGDVHGNVVHLFERDCTLQRRNQKVIEEAPAPGMSPELREQMCAAAVKLARSVGYEGAGTIEFLVEGGALGPDAPWYFIEMNTRLQVEHPVTEEITGLDLVEWQLRVAAGERLPRGQAEIAMRGHAIETRLCAEDPARDFLPSIGPVHAFDPPQRMAGLRVETGVAAGGAVSPFYDSMIAKLITHAPTRADAAGAMTAALRATVIAGPVTNQAFLAALLSDKRVASGAVDTGLIGRELARFTAPAPPPASAIAAGVAMLLTDRADGAEAGRAGDAAGLHSPWHARDGFQLGPPRIEQRLVMVDGQPTTFDVRWRAEGAQVAVPAGRQVASAADPRVSLHRVESGRVLIVAGGVQSEVAFPRYDASGEDDGASGDAVRAPINGRVAKVFVAAGGRVEKGHRIAVVEAMKMEHVLVAPRAGDIERVAVSEGEQVMQGALIAALGKA